ncbi:hypothetical protein G6F46_014339 [Rhizopus delemar]|nr:hypothetical protein G6F46_014339 [Rhizopus delemar]
MQPAACARSAVAAAAPAESGRADRGRPAPRPANGAGPVPSASRGHAPARRPCAAAPNRPHCRCAGVPGVAGRSSTARSCTDPPPGSRPPGRRPVPGRGRETTHYECQGAPGPSVRCSVGVDWQCHRD